MTRNNKFHRKLRDFFGNDDAVLKSLMIIFYLVGLAFVWRHQDQIAGLTVGVDLISPELYAVLTHSVTAYIIGAGAALIYGLCYPFGKRMAAEQFTNIGFANHSGMTPELRRKKRDKKHPNVTIWIFRNHGIPLDVWDRFQTAIEAVLDISIIKMTYGKSKMTTWVYAVSSMNDLPDMAEWDN